MIFLLPAMFGACDLPLPPPRDCVQRRAFYPDDDGDGFGEPTEVYVGCEAPPGWVSVLPPTDSTLMTPTGPTGGPTAETALPTGDTGPVLPTGPTGDTAPEVPTADTVPEVPTADTAIPTGDTAPEVSTADTTADTATPTGDTVDTVDTAAPTGDTGAATGDTGP